ncbi:hypothetical protein DMUE_3280 [Dictyocoela muelleri]|nr:hypothetical protein DMUE_3280 [Dictyocoela muelleri]
MKNLVQDEHEKNHFGINKSEHYFNGLYFRIKSEIIHEVIKECYKCSQMQPLKQKIPMIHIKSKRSTERYQINCVDLSRYETENYSTKFILNIIDVFTKFCIAQAIRDKKNEKNQKIFRKNIFFHTVFQKF